MKYSEFETEVEKMGYEVSILENYIYIAKNNRTYAKVSKTSRYVIDTHYGSFLALYESDAFKIYEACMMLTETPLAEREEEKRYWLQKIPVPLLDKEGEKKWLWKYTGTALSNVFGADTTKIDSELYKTIFTESEIAEMDIAGFEKVEVEE